MILLSELFNTLANSELLNLSLSATPTGALSAEHYPKVVSHINLGLTELYKRFNLLQTNLDLHQYEGVNTYYIRKEHMGDVLDMDDVAYIAEDFDNPFKDNIVKVVDAYDALGNQLTLNDSNDVNSLITLSHDTIHFKEIDIPQVISLVCQCYHPKIAVTETFDPTTYKLYVPEFILEALFNYIAARVYRPMGSNSSGVDAGKSISFMQLFELSCQQIETLGLDTQTNKSSDSFSAGGWV
jgi:hypothetical protein